MIQDKKQVDTETVINKTKSAINDYSKYVKDNPLLASEDVKISNNKDKSSVEYISDQGSFKIQVSNDKVTAKASFGDNKYTAEAKNNEVIIKGNAPLFLEHWSKFSHVFDKEDDWLL